MQAPENHADPRPAYVQIADDLRGQIASGELPPPSRLPTLKDLTDRYGVAVETVRKGIAVLAKEGVVSPGSTRGTFVLKMPGEPEPSPDVQAVIGAVLKLAERMDSMEERLNDHLRGTNGS
jgi:GntR family transcriptional regulator